MLFGLLEARVVNKIIARVNGVNILKTDLERPRINSSPYSLESAITQELYFQEATRQKLVPSNLEVEKYIALYRSGNQLKDLSDEEFAKHLQEKEGFSIPEFKSEYARYVAVSNLMQIEVKNRVFITAQEVEDYYKKNPEWIDERYKLKTALISFQDAPTEQDVLKIKKIDWVSQDDWIYKDNIAENMSVIFSLKKNEISKPIKTQYGYQLVQVIDKELRRKKTLQEAYIDVEKRLRAKKLDKFEDEYKQELKSKATVVHLDK